MATLSAKVYKHHKKADGTYNVKICIYHNSSRVFIDTEHYVTDKKLTKTLLIKDTFINSYLNRTLDDYRDSVSSLGKRLHYFTAEQLKEYLLNKDQVIDLLQFAQIHIDILEENNQTKSAANYRTLRNHLSDYVKINKLPIEEVSLPLIKDFERFLRNPRMMIRKDQFNREYKMAGKPLSDASIHNYFRDFSGLFSAAKKYYNKPALGLFPITYNPFEEYTIVDAPETDKLNIGAEGIIKVRDCIHEPGGRLELAVKLGMLSFYLCGMNAVDFYKQDYVIKNGRVEYNRSKTKGKRKDKAFISIKIPQEAIELLEFATTLPARYSCIGNLNKALSKGMAQLSKLTGIPRLKFYSLRHSFGSIARNNCRLELDFIGEALNHVEHGRSTTKIYIEKDWSIVDEVQTAVIAYVNRVDRKLNNKMRVAN
jgi:hypothetical protein